MKVGYEFSHAATAGNAYLDSIFNPYNRVGEIFSPLSVE